MGQVSPRQMLEAQAELERQKLLPRRIKGARVPRPWEIETQVHLSASLNPLPGLVDGKRLGKSSVARATPLTISPVKRRKGKNAGRTDVRNIKRQKQIGLLLKGDDRHVKVNGIMEQYRPSTADHLSHIKRIVLKDEKTRGEMGILERWLLPICPFLEKLDQPLRDDLISTIGFQEYDIGESVCDNDRCGVVLSGQVIARLIPRDEVFQTAIEDSENRAKQTLYALSDGERMLKYLDATKTPREKIARARMKKEESLDSSTSYIGNALFDEMDDSKAGHVTRDQVRVAFEDYGSNISQADLNAIMNEVGKEEVDSRCFLWWLQQNSGFATVLRQAFVDNKLLPEYLFRFVDVDKSGDIDFDEFQQALVRCEVILSDEQILEAKDAVGFNATEEIDYVAFRKWFKRQGVFAILLKKATVTVDIFKYIDEDRSGTIDNEKLQKALKKLRIQLMKSDLNAVMAEMNPDKDGEITLTSFEAWINGQPPFAVKLLGMYLLGRFHANDDEMDTVTSTEDSTRLAKHIFSYIDTDKIGYFVADIFKERCSGLSMTMSSARLHKVMKDLEANEYGRITEEAFLLWFGRKSIFSTRLGKAYVLHQSNAVFDFIDASNSGTVGIKEIEKAILKWGVRLTTDIATTLIYEIGAETSNEQFSKDVFTTWFQAQSNLAVEIHEGFTEYNRRQSTEYILRQEAQRIFQNIAMEGELDEDLLQTSLVSYGIGLDNEGLKALMVDIGCGSNSFVNETQFQAWFVQEGEIASSIKTGYYNHVSDSMFKDIDTDGDGSITQVELHAAFNTYGMEVDVSEIETIMKEIDENGDGEIDAEEFQAWFNDQSSITVTKLCLYYTAYKQKSSKEYISSRTAGQIFEAIDSGESGTFNFVQLHEATKLFGMEYDKKDTEFLIDEIVPRPPTPDEDDEEETMMNDPKSLVISRSQFRRWFVKHNRSAKVLEQAYFNFIAIKIFNAMDTHLTGLLNVEMIGNSLRSFGVQVPAEELQNLISEIDTVRDNSCIDVEGFKTWFCKRDSISTSIHAAYLEAQTLARKLQVKLEGHKVVGTDLFRVLCNPEDEEHLTRGKFRYGLLLIRFEPCEGLGALFNEIANENAEVIDEHAFVQWYCQQSLSAVQLHSAFRAVAETVYNVLDTEQAKKIDGEKMRSFFSAIDSEISEYEVDQMSEEMEADDSGDIDVNAFLKWFQTAGNTAYIVLKEILQRQLLSEATRIFEVFDFNGNGGIDYEELVLGCEILGMEYTRDRVRKMMDMLDEDGDEEVDQEEFTNWYIEQSLEGKDMSKRFKEYTSMRLGVQIFTLLDIDCVEKVNLAQMIAGLKRLNIERLPGEVFLLMKEICSCSASAVADAQMTHDTVEVTSAMFNAWFDRNHPLCQELWVRMLFLLHGNKQTKRKLKRGAVKQAFTEKDGETSHKSPGPPVEKPATIQENSRVSIVCQDIFTLFDDDGNGSIDLEELRDGLSKYSIGLTLKATKLLMTEIDNTHDGEISLLKFKPWFERQRSPVAIELFNRYFRLGSIATSIFRAIDTRGAGALSKVRIWSAFKSMGMGLTEAQVRSLVQEVNAKVAGDEVAEDAFRAWFKRQSPIAIRLHVRYLLTMVNDQRNPGTTLTTGALVGPRWTSNVGEPDFANFTAQSHTEVIYIMRGAYDSRILQQHKARVKKLAERVKSAFPVLFEKWSRARMQRLCDKTRIIVLKDAKEEIYAAEDPNTSMYFLLSGSVALTTTVTIRQVTTIPTSDRTNPIRVEKNITHRVPLRKVSNTGTFGETALVCYKPKHAQFEEVCTHSACSAEPGTTLLEIFDKEAFDLLKASGTTRQLLQNPLKFDHDEVAQKHAKYLQERKQVKKALYDSSKPKTRNRVAERLRQERVHRERTKDAREKKLQALERRRKSRAKVKGMYRPFSLPNLPVVSPIVDKQSIRTGTEKSARHAVLLSDTLPFQNAAQQLNFSKAKRWFQGTIADTRFDPKIKWEEDGTMTLSDFGDKRSKPFPKMTETVEE